MDLSQKPVLTIKNLSKSFGKIQAVDSISLEIKKGEIIGFLGPNGAGKSTTFAMICKLVKPTSGSITVLERNVWRDAGSLNNVGVMFERSAFYDNLSAYRNLKMLGRLKRTQSTEHINDLLKMVGLYERRKSKVAIFSQGMKQKLAIAAALLGNPELLLLDEPMNGLDPEATRQMLNLLYNKASKERISILISSHMLHDIEEYCDRFFLINHGKLVSSGSLDSVLKTDNNIIIISFSEQIPTENDILKIEGVSNALKISNNTFEVHLRKVDSSALNSALISLGYKVSTISPKKMSLEDHFISVTVNGAKK